jgi:hypothetical protein
MSRIEAEMSKILDIAKMCDKEGFCKLCLCKSEDDKLIYSLYWDIQTGEEFVKASALVHKIAEWANCGYGEDGYVAYCAEDPDKDLIYIFEVSCVWL